MMKATVEAKRTPHVVIFLRVPPALHEAVQAAVAGANMSRQWGDLRMTINSYVLRCIEAMVDPGKEKAAGKQKASKKTRRK